MSRFALSTLVVVAIASRSAFAQPDPADPTPLTAKTYPYTAIPYQVDPVTSAIRGPQTGYNICNSTTQNQQSECQTAIFNNIDDFCLWAPPLPNSTIGNTEAVEVAWCSKSGHGTRLIPQGALQGVQLLVTSEYYQLAGFIDQTMVNMAYDDYGGELDPHGADLRGNPLGGLVYSDGFPKIGASNGTYTQVMDWNAFIGGNAFCITVCNPSSSSANQSAYCQNIYDLIGCANNMPNNAKNGTFEVCDADLKTPAGLYTSNGATLTFSQPAVGPVTVPYTVNVPSSSNCVTYKSSDLYTSLPLPTGATSTGTGASQTGKASSSSSAGAPSATTNGASALGISSVAAILGTLFAITFLS